MDLIRIEGFKTGFRDDVTPALLPDDGMPELLDGYVWRRDLKKRLGYTPLAIGLSTAATPYCESRVVNRITLEDCRTSGLVLVTGNGTPGPYTFRIQQGTAGNKDIRRGTVTVTAGAQSGTDNGLGGWATAGYTGTVDYYTGDVTVTFPLNVGGGTQLFVTYDLQHNSPVIGAQKYVPTSNVEQLIVFTDKYINRYNPGTNRLDNINRAMAVSTISNANPAVVTTTANHLMQTGDKVLIFGVLGIVAGGVSLVNGNEYTITRTGAATFSIPVDTAAASAYASGGTAEQIYQTASPSFFNASNIRSATDTPRLLFVNNIDIIQSYDGSTVSDLQFTLTGVTRLTAKHIFYMQDRIILLDTLEDGVRFPTRIRISGTAASIDNFDLTTTGAGIIELSDGNWITAATINRNDLFIYTSGSLWAMKYSGNDVAPFQLERVGASAGSDASQSAITWFNQSVSISKAEISACDGYQTKRIDEHIPEYVQRHFNLAQFQKTFGYIVETDWDAYWIYCDGGSTTTNRILNYNFMENNWDVYRAPWTVMTMFEGVGATTWSGLSIYPTWAAWAAAVGTWSASGGSTRLAYVAGGNNGQVWEFMSGSADDQQAIRNVTIAGSTITVTTDLGTWAVGDIVSFTAVGGITGLNNQQASIQTVVSQRQFTISLMGVTGAYTSGGFCSKSIPFTCKTKRFNPYASSGRNCKLVWVKAYLESQNAVITGQTPKLSVNVFIDDNSSPTTGTTYEFRMQNLTTEQGTQRWAVSYINQEAPWVQLQLHCAQALTDVRVRALLLAFEPGGMLENA